MFRRKKKDDEPTDTPAAPAQTEDAQGEVSAEPAAAAVTEQAAPEAAAPVESNAAAAGDDSKATTGKRRGNRVQKVGTVSSDKMQKTVIVRVDRLVLHRKYRRYVRRTSRFMAHDELGATTGDRVRIVETRPLSARKRWRVVEIVQKAAK